MILNTGHFTKLNNESLVNFICCCGNTYIKKFRTMFENGGFCESCTNINKIIKSKQTNLKRRNVQHPIQNLVIKEKIKQTNLRKYGVEYPMQNRDIQEKTKQTNLEKYGVEYLSQNLKIKEKIKQVNLIKTGFENQFQSDIIKKIIKQTNLEIYGVENPSQSEEIKEKKRITTSTNYGVNYPGQSVKIKEKIKRTNLERYGVEYPLQNSEIFEKQLKNSFKLKDFTFPNGIVINVQGYEPIVLKTLIEQGYKQTDLITSRKEVPEIWYNELNKIHRYYCDIYIKSENRIIEVKSTWTYNKDLHINNLKADTCKVKGYCFEFWIFDNKMNCKIIKI